MDEETLFSVHARDSTSPKRATTMCGIRVALAEYITDVREDVTCRACLAILDAGKRDGGAVP